MDLQEKAVKGEEKKSSFSARLEGSFVPLSVIMFCLLTDTYGTGKRSPHTAHTLQDERGQMHHNEDSGALLDWPAGGQEGEERGREAGRMICREMGDNYICV